MTTNIYSIQTAEFTDSSRSEVYVEAVIQDAVYIPGSQTHLDPPEYGPGLFSSTFSTDFFPEGLELEEDKLIELVEQHIDLDSQEWILMDTSDD